MGGVFVTEVFKQLTVCLPTYHGLETLGPAFDSIFAQSAGDYEIVIGNDSPDDHEEVEAFLKKINDPRIRLLKNERNLGYPENIKKIVSAAKHDVLFFMCQDDVLLSNNIFSKALVIFTDHPDVGAITRPYYWFKHDLNKPIRLIEKYPKNIISADGDEESIDKLFETLGQLTGLIMRKSLITHDFIEHIFPCHAAPFLSIIKTHKVYLWEDYMIAVRTTHSQTQLSRIYNPSPTFTWINMFKNVFPEPQFDKIRSLGIEKFSTNYLGLVQIKNYGFFRDYCADVYHLVKERKRNLISPKFWFYFLGTLLIPRVVLRRLVGIFKDTLGNQHASRKIPELTEG